MCVCVCLGGVADEPAGERVGDQEPLGPLMPPPPPRPRPPCVPRARGPASRPAANVRTREPPCPPAVFPRRRAQKPPPAGFPTTRAVHWAEKPPPARRTGPGPVGRAGFKARRLRARCGGAAGAGGERAQRQAFSNDPGRAAASEARAERRRSRVHCRCRLSATAVVYLRGGGLECTAAVVYLRGGGLECTAVLHSRPTSLRPRLSPVPRPAPPGRTSACLPQGRRPPAVPCMLPGRPGSAHCQHQTAADPGPAAPCGMRLPLSPDAGDSRVPLTQPARKALECSTSREARPRRLERGGGGIHAESSTGPGPLVKPVRARCCLPASVANPCQRRWPTRVSVGGQPVSASVASPCQRRWPTRVSVGGQPVTPGIRAPVSHVNAGAAGTAGTAGRVAATPHPHGPPHLPHPELQSSAVG